MFSVGGTVLKLATGQAPWQSTTEFTDLVSVILHISSAFGETSQDPRSPFPSDLMVLCVTVTNHPFLRGQKRAVKAPPFRCQRPCSEALLRAAFILILRSVQTRTPYSCIRFCLTLLIDRTQWSISMAQRP